MKIRIQGNYIRLRLSQNEVELFSNTGKVTDRIDFGSHTLSYELVTTKKNEVSAQFNESIISILVPEEISEIWTNTDQVGIENGDQSLIRILVEKDFQCLHKRSGEDESNNFPNPMAK